MQHAGNVGNEMPVVSCHNETPKARKTAQIGQNPVCKMQLDYREKHPRMLGVSKCITGNE